MKSLRLTSDNEHLQKADLKFVDSCLAVPARVLPPPSFVFGSREIATARPEDCTWRGRQFLRSVNIGTDWGAYLFTGRLDNISDQDFM